MTKILVLEDEASIRSFILVNLKRYNFDIVEAASGEEALEKIDETVDIALLDVMLPESAVLMYAKGYVKSIRLWALLC